MVVLYMYFLCDSKFFSLFYGHLPIAPSMNSQRKL